MTKRLHNRVGRKRMNAQHRRISIMSAIATITIVQGKKATVTSVANELGMTPSTHLKNMLNAMWIGNKITAQQTINGRGQTVLNYGVHVEYQSGCDLPFICHKNDFCINYDTGEICVSKERKDNA